MKLTRRIQKAHTQFINHTRKVKADNDRVKALRGFNYDNLMDDLIRSVPNHV